MDLYRTPYTLAKVVAGSKIRLAVTILIHLVFGMAYVYILPGHPVSFLVFMVVFPAYYLRSLHWLIRFAEEKTLNNDLATGESLRDGER